MTGFRKLAGGLFAWPGLWLVLIGFCGVLSSTWAQSPTERMEQANESYRNQSFETAIEVYETLLSEGYRSEALYYNLGNAYYRIGNLGNAVLNFERALKIAPGDTEILHNLEVIHDQFPDGMDPVDQFFLARWWSNVFQLGSVTFWSVFGIVMLWLAVAGFIIWLLAKERKNRKRGFFFGMIVLGLSVLPFALANGRYNFEQSEKEAVILADNTNLHRGADTASETVGVLPAGIKMSLLDMIGDWYKVRLVNGEEGWVQKSALGII